MFMPKSKTVLAHLGVCAFFIAPALGQTTNAEAPLRAVVECRALEDSADRLACFDRTSAVLESSLDTGAVLAVTREDIDTAERDTFGLSLPNIGALARSLTSPGQNEAMADLSPDTADTAVTVAGADAADTTDAQGQQTAQASTPPQTREEVLAQSDTLAASRSGVEVQERGQDGRAIKVVMEIERYQEVGYQQGRFYMTNGQVWEQTRTQSHRMPSRGAAYAHIRRTSTGIHLLRINDRGNAIQVRRTR
ncbi:hypothetical protein [Oceanicaulis sp.]|uniref:hypothetical protein n=1 Tax=Oceanicaulis sp. TaxID=1924941 RepID=UPI003F727467